MSLPLPKRALGSLLGQWVVARQASESWWRPSPLAKRGPIGLFSRHAPRRRARDRPGRPLSVASSFMRFSVYGRFKLDVVRERNQWAVYRLELGKRTAVREFAIPSSLPEAEIATFLDDIYHELAKPGQTVQLESAGQ
jgi:hypothetical protein